MRRAQLVACAALAALAALASGGTSRADAPSSVGTIAFESQETIYALDASGSGSARALGSPLETPSWAPDGKKLAVSGGTGVYTIDADGTNKTTIVSGPGLIDPSWSPDGSTIAFADVSTGSAGIWITPATAGGTPTLRLRHNGVDTSPVWSPDGKKIAFLESDITANPPNIWIMNADDGSNPKELVTPDLPDPGGGNLRNLAWSPDGTKLAYSTGAEPEVYGAGLRSASIAVVSVADSAEHILVAPPGDQADFTDPSWSPDGTSIIFSDTPLSGPPATTLGLDIANADGTNRRSLFTAPGNFPVDSAQWLPGVPGAPTAASPSPTDGQVSVSFAAPATNGGAPITSYTVTASPGGAMATGSSGPLTVTGLADGTTYTFSIVAANRIGAGAAALVSATPTAPPSPPAPSPPAPSGGGGGGSGGGGGGSSGIPPDIHVDVSASSTTAPAVGAELDYLITVSSKNTGGSSDTTLRLVLPTGYAVTSVSADRGPGCTGSALDLTCDVGFINPSASTHVRIAGTVGQAGEQDLTATATGFPEPELNASDNSLTLKLLPQPATSDAGAGGTGASSGPTKLVALAPPRLAGRAAVGHTVRAAPPTWNERPATVRYQWELCVRSICRAIRGATTQALVLRRSYLGKTVRVVVTGGFASRRVRSTSARIGVRA